MVTPHTSHDERLLDSSGLVAFDVPCRKCGYNVRALSADGLCPECAHPIRLSLRSDDLRYADPAWLRRIAIGLRLSFWGELSGQLCGNVYSLLAIFTAAPGLINMWMAASFARIACSLVYQSGGWLLTQQDPAGQPQEGALSARRLIRIAAVCAVACHIVGWPRRLSPGLGDPTVLLLMALSAATAVGEFARLSYLRWFAQRMGNGSQSRRARLLFWLYGGGGALMLVTSWGGWLASLSLNYSLANLLRLAWTSLSVILIIFSVMYVVLLARMGAGVRAAIRESRFSESLQDQAEGACSDAAERPGGNQPNT